MAIKGDFDKLESLMRGLRVAGERGAEEVARYVKDEAAKLTRGQLRRAETPEGLPWVPLVLSDQDAQRVQQRAERAAAKGKELTGRGGLRKPLSGVDAGVDARTVDIRDGAAARVEIRGKEARIAHYGVRRARKVFGRGPFATNVQPARPMVPRRQLPARWYGRILGRAQFVIWRLIKQGSPPAAPLSGL